MASTASLRERRRRRPQTGRNVVPEVVDLDQYEFHCIDLTSDEGRSSTQDESVIDLTSPTGANDSSIVVLETEPSDLPVLIARPGSRTVRSSNQDVDTSNNEILSVIDDNIMPSNSPKDSMLSPDGKELTCPICMDDLKRITDIPVLATCCASFSTIHCNRKISSGNNIKRSGRRMSSTTCGHVFCSDCIDQAISIQHCCPTCRKKLSKKQVHVLFI